MRKTAIWAIVGALMMFAPPVSADVFVQGYYKKDGTYVQPHYRSSPNRSYNDNWSVSPNINPYTGQQGTRPPTLDYQPPRFYTPPLSQTRPRGSRRPKRSGPRP